MDRPKLGPEDQRKVDAFTSSGIHSVERKPFRPLLLLLMVITVTTVMTLLAIFIERLYIP
ncbi:MAG: DUF3094 family protein [Gammaproteobacteria bacterium]|jgi:hypothetical protein|nr:DUF3094 family protein [Gammaproteobacteria bacterium]MBP6052675.1 DUF3094 family protein [Pseudomonadales bacterium]MBK6583298.1 DUF3094 family protein [Gammaproteobacteria bacterium]MBK7170871.1 DUF3094 family protein [Gammaproteobacteria bacterium]MBK7519446.1 DUF3094 family protein [Gammaproteobacteria bacterium]